MNRLSVTACAAVIIIECAPTAEACRPLKSPTQRIQEAYAKHSDLRVALVTIDQARHLMNPMLRAAKKTNPDFEGPWRATASVFKLVLGDESPELLIFDRNDDSCDDGTTMPNAGDQWVIYYTSDHPIGFATVLESYPINVARRVDARVRNVR